MPHTNRRYEYLSNYHFYNNNIDFRIASSQALEKFKNVQSFQLNQLQNGKFFFPQEVREILLLKFDMWSRFLTEIENFFVELDNSHHDVEPNEIDFIISLANITNDKYKSIMTTAPTKEYFDEEFSNIWLEMHEDMFQLMLLEIGEMSGNHKVAFACLSDILCRVMQYTLIELHELNELMQSSNKNETFLVVTQLCSHFLQNTGVCLLSRRAQVYKKYFNISKIWLKNYTDSPITRLLINQLTGLGLEIDFERSLTN